jgi:hypothetical protein
VNFGFGWSVPQRTPGMRSFALNGISFTLQPEANSTCVR